MKSHLLISALSSFIFLFSSAQGQKTISSAQWQEDVKYFQEQLVKMHKNAFHRVSKEEFEKDIELLYKDLPSLKDYQIIVRLMQITAKVGDGHTAVHLPSAFKRYPIRFFWFDEGLCVVATTEEYKDILGTKLSKIGNLSVEKVSKKLYTIISQDENKWYWVSTAVALLNIAEIVGALGLVPDHELASFTFLDSSNKEITRELKAMVVDPQRKWMAVDQPVPLYRQNINSPFSFTYLPDVNAVYLSFKRYEDMGFNCNNLFKFIDEKKATRLIVDLRYNGGGDFTKGQRFLISRIKENTTINQKGNLFVITGRMTFSAAMVNSIDFKKQTNAIIVGEPPGEKPNSYSENDEMKLPHSGLVVSYSTRYYKFLDEDVPAFEPDVRIDPNWKDYKAGRDPVMEWIISSCKK